MLALMSRRGEKSICVMTFGVDCSFCSISKERVIREDDTFALQVVCRNAEFVGIHASTVGSAYMTCFGLAGL